MTKEDFLASFIVNLVMVGEDRNGIYYSYRRNGNTKIETLEVSKRFPKDNDDEYYSINITLCSDGVLEINGTEDKDISKANIKEFYKQLKEKYDQQQEMYLKQAWARMGVYE